MAAGKRVFGSKTFSLKFQHNRRKCELDPVLGPTFIPQNDVNRPESSGAAPSSIHKLSLAASLWGGSVAVSMERPPLTPKSKKKAVEVLVKGSTRHLDPCLSAPLFLLSRGCVRGHELLTRLK